MANELLSFLQRAMVNKRDVETNPFLAELGIADLVDGPPRQATVQPGMQSEAPPMMSPRQAVGELGTAPAIPRRFKIPSANELADAWQDIRMMTASDQEAHKRYAPQLDAIRALAIDRHHQDFKGDPIAAPVAYARHMGALAGRFGEPMSPAEAAKWQQYLEGEQADSVNRAKKAISEGNLWQINRSLENLMGPGWKATKVEPGTYTVGNLELPANVVTLIGPDGNPHTINSTEFEMGQASLETRLRVAEANRKAQVATGGTGPSASEETFQTKIMPELVKTMSLDTPADKVRFNQTANAIRAQMGLPPLGDNVSYDGMFRTGEGDGTGTGTPTSATGTPDATAATPTEPLSARTKSQQQSYQKTREQKEATRARKEQREATLARLEQTWTDVRQNEEKRQEAIAELDRIDQEQRGNLSASEIKRMERLMNLLTMN